MRRLKIIKNGTRVAFPHVKSQKIYNYTVQRIVNLFKVEHCRRLLGHVPDTGKRCLLFSILPFVIYSLHAKRVPAEFWFVFTVVGSDFP